MRNVSFVGSSLDDLRSWPKKARQDMGRQLDRVQKGRDPTDWRPMSSAGRGVKEIRIHDAGSIYRSMYTTNIVDAVYVLHVFVKKSRKTPLKDIRLAKSRLKALLQDLGIDS
ncbi:MAG: type II toxin-antitoxin system RelE/ParE family toxin [Acidobacteria bacterium]|nr:type II toxin-antitoxin system RelE/ParE family toxin [Acidobacteriota bacterium]